MRAERALFVHLRWKFACQPRGCIDPFTTTITRRVECVKKHGRDRRLGTGAPGGTRGIARFHPVVGRGGTGRWTGGRRGSRTDPSARASARSQSLDKGGTEMRKDGNAPSDPPRPARSPIARPRRRAGRRRSSGHSAARGVCIPPHTPSSPRLPSSPPLAALHEGDSPAFRAGARWGTQLPLVRRPRTAEARPRASRLSPTGFSAVGGGERTLTRGRGPWPTSPCGRALPAS